MGQEAWVSTKNEKYLTSKPPQSKTAFVMVRYSGKPIKAYSIYKGWLIQQWARLTTGNGISAYVTLNSEWNSHSPIAIGQHFIMAPDRSHANISTEGYAKSAGAIYTDVWFPIQLAGQRKASSRYIHIGHLSEGCVTVHELTKWNDIYNYLIGNRMPKEGRKIIGKLFVLP